MRIFLAGATGVIGARLVPLLAAAGHEVTGMTRTPEKADGVAAAGATPVVCDVFDLPALREVMAGVAPHVVLHQLTDLPDDAARIADHFAANNRIRREGTANLLAAGTAAPVSPRMLAQSIAWSLPGEGGAATDALERSVLEAGGVVLRYGQFYGPGTFHPGTPPPPPRIHVDEAARRTVDLLTAPSGVVVVEEAESPSGR